MPTIRDNNGKVDPEATAINFINDSQNSFTLRQRRDRAQVNQDYERGDQWSAEEWDIYKSKGVDPVTINECRPAVKGLVGLQLSDQQELRVRPRKNATESSARVYSELLKHTQDLAYSDFKYTDLFHQGLSDPEAFIAVNIDKRANINGQPQLKVYGQMDVDVDPNNDTYDISGGESEHDGAEFVILKDWVPIDWLNKQYPDKAMDINNHRNFDPGDTTNADTQMENFVKWHTDSGAMFIDDDEFGNEDTDKYLRDRYRYRMYTVYWRENVDAVYVSDRQTGTTKRFTDSKNIRRFRRLVKKSDRFEVINDTGKKLHRTVMLGNVIMLETKADPFGEQISDYPVFRFSTFWKDGKASAFLDDIVQLNHEKNIHRTQNIKILNSVANSGYIVGGGTKPKLQALANYGSVDNVIIDASDYGGKVEKIKPNPLSPGHFTMDQVFSSDLERVSGIDENTKGITDDKNQSGRAKFLQDTSNKRASGMIIAHNFYHTLELLGVFLLKMIRHNEIYTPEEIRQVVSESTLVDKTLMDRARRSLQDRTGADLPQPSPLPPVTPEMLAGVRPEDQTDFLETIQSGTEVATQYLKDFPRLSERFEEVVKEEAIDLLMAELKDDGVAEYGIKVTLSPTSPTSRMSTAADLGALVQAGIPVPPQIFVDATDLQPNIKEELKAFFQAQQIEATGAQPGAAVGAA